MTWRSCWYKDKLESMDLDLFYTFLEILERNSDKVQTLKLYGRGSTRNFLIRNELFTARIKKLLQEHKRVQLSFSDTEINIGGRIDFDFLNLVDLWRESRAYVWIRLTQFELASVLSKYCDCFVIVLIRDQMELVARFLSDFAHRRKILIRSYLPNSAYGSVDVNLDWIVSEKDARELIESQGYEINSVDLNELYFNEHKIIINYEGHLVNCVADNKPINVHLEEALGMASLKDFMFCLDCPTHPVCRKLDEYLFFI